MIFLYIVFASTPAICLLMKLLQTTQLMFSDSIFLPNLLSLPLHHCLNFARKDNLVFWSEFNHFMLSRQHVIGIGRLN